MKINNRRYTGSKYKLIEWIKKRVLHDCKRCNSFIDIFAGTGIVTAEMLENYEVFVLNDILYSNEVIYRAFFGCEKFSQKKLNSIKNEYANLDAKTIKGNYVSKYFGNKYFSKNDAKLIGYIRDDVEKKYISKSINEKEYYILLTSLLYSFDKISNTVGHYDAYRKNTKINDIFSFDLIEPYNCKGKKIHIYRDDANSLARKIKGDICFIDPPYSSRQYSRFYHVLETIIKWDKPKLSGAAMKPKEENMSEYCKASAPVVFSDLIDNLDVKYIVVTYNNTYDSKSSSSINKITLDEIVNILNSKGKTTIYEHNHKPFNAGKTDLSDHKEYLFITKVKKKK